MRSKYFCLRLSLGVLHTRRKHREQKESLEADGNATSDSQRVQPPVRAVSPADVRRTESGRLVKQKSGPQAVREPSVSMRVLGGSQLKNCDVLVNGTINKGLQGAAVQQDTGGRTDVKRILQPVHKPHTDCKPQKKVLQLLRLSKSSLNNLEPPSARSPEPAACKSILEASEKRLQRHQQAVPLAMAESQAVTVQLFSDAYLLAVSSEDQQWALATEIAAIFSPDAVLKTQDKQTFYGKQAVLRRLNSGIQHW